MSVWITDEILFYSFFEDVLHHYTGCRCRKHINKIQYSCGMLSASAPCIPLYFSASLMQKHWYDRARKMKIWNNIFMLTICNGFSNFKVKFKRTYINDIKFQWFMYMKLNKIGRNIVKQFLNRIYERMRGRGKVIS